MNTQQIVFTAPGVAQMQGRTLPEPGAGQVLVKTAYTMISAGTERANLMGMRNTHAHIVDDSQIPLFPKTLGYCGVGTVQQIGEGVASVKEGDRVVVYFGTHSAHTLMPEEKVVRIEDDATDLLDAVPAVIAQIAMSGVRMARIELGESVMIMGLGVLGMYAVQWCRLAGAAPILVADPNPRRRERALALGADYALDPFAPDFAGQVQALTAGGVNVGIEVSGAAIALEQMLDCTAKMARVVLLGCTRVNDRCIDYYHKVHYRGIAILGAHTVVRPQVDSRPGYWTWRDEIQAVLRLASGGRIRLADNIDEVHSAREAPAVFTRLAEDANFPIGVVLDWRGIE